MGGGISKRKGASASRLFHPRRLTGGTPMLRLKTPPHPPCRPQPRAHRRGKTRPHPLAAPGLSEPNKIQRCGLRRLQPAATRCPRGRRCRLFQSAIHHPRSPIAWPDKLPEQVAIIRKLIGIDSGKVIAPNGKSRSVQFGRKNKKRNTSKSSARVLGPK